MTNKLSILLKIAISFIIIYIIQFLLFPLILPNYSYGDNSGTTLFISINILVVLGMIYISNDLKYWFLSNFIYLFLIWIYPAQGAYTIGEILFSSFSREDVWFSLIWLLFTIIPLESICSFIIRRNTLLKERAKDNKLKKLFAIITLIVIMTIITFLLYLGVFFFILYPISCH